MKQKPFTAEQLRKLRANADIRDSAVTRPVVKFFTPWAGATWLISELDEDNDTMFGLCDLGHGSPELGYVSLSELRSLRGPFGLTVERDLHFRADKTLAEYADAARETGSIAA